MSEGPGGARQAVPPDRFGMLIVCPNCASEYTLTPERIGAAGRQVRCAMCGESWFVHPDKLRARPQEPASDWAGDERRSVATIEGTTRPERGRAAQDRPGRKTGVDPSVGSGPAAYRGKLAVAATLALLLLIPTAIAFRTSVVRLWPESAALFAAISLPINLVGIELAGVASGITEEAGARVLLVDGEIRSASPVAVSVPRLEFTVEGERGDVLYRWSTKPPVAEIAPGETTRFTARLASPPPAGRRILVSFKRERDGESIALR